MANKIKIGHDKLPAPVIPDNVPLYNLQTGRVLTDEGGVPIVSAEDIVLTSNATSKKSTSVVFTNEIKGSRTNDLKLTGKNFQALNRSIFTIEMLNPGSGFPSNSVDVVYTIPSPVNGVSAKLTYSANTSTGTSGVNGTPVITFGGAGYSNGYTFSITPGGSGTAAQFRVTQVLSEVSGENCLFVQELSIGDRIKLPTGIDSNGVPIYEIRSVGIIRNNNSILFEAPVTIPRKKTTSGVGFGKLIRQGFIRINSILPVEEQFATFSEVSTTILGIPKAETQLSLFSNVSSYGLDNDEFLFYITEQARQEPDAWERRKSLYYGAHTAQSELIEEKEESALILKSFPTPYTYPFGPNANNYGWDVNAHANYNRFFKLGCLLYDYYSEGGGGYPGDNGDYARNFMPHVKNHVSVDSTSIVLYENGNRLATIAPALFRPPGDSSGAILNYFITNESIYYVDQWNQNTNTFTGPPIGTVKLFNFDFTLHFNQEVGLIYDQFKSQSQNSNTDLQIVGGTSLTVATIDGDLNYSSAGISAGSVNKVRAEQNFWINFQSPLNPYYNNDADLFNQVDTWTETWRKIRSGNFPLPAGQGFFDIETDIGGNPLINKYIYELSPVGYNGDVWTESRPGHSSNITAKATLLSRKAFRYQPGRISGFTFGLRASGDASTSDVRLEWGIGNDTDELMFQIRGANFSIVRRSVVPLSDAVMERNNLDPGDENNKLARESDLSSFVNFGGDSNYTSAQGSIAALAAFFDGDQKPIQLDTQNQESFTGLQNKVAFETVIPRDVWNGDPLNGNGPSGWNWSAEDVTMYKIEFGWYGAIGVKFYAYVPIANNESRWVRLHTLVIENQLNRPCMGDPYYKFKYVLNIDNTDQVTTPQFVYKYGTSCYIDGGDEGTVKVGSAFSGEKRAPIEEGGVNKSTTLVGLIPKTLIYNSVGERIKNKQSIFPRELSLSSNGLTEVSLVKCVGCPGFGHTYMPNLTSGYRGVERYFVQPALGSLGSVDRGALELPELTRRCYGSSGSNQVVLSNSVNDVAGLTATNPTKFLRVNDVFDPNNITGAFTSGTNNYAYITNINKITNTITLSRNLGVNIGSPSTQTGIDVKIQPLFIGSKDEYTKVIADGVFLTYIGRKADWQLLSGSYSDFPLNEIIATQTTLVSSEGINFDQSKPQSYYFEGRDGVDRTRLLEEKRRAGFGFVFAPTEFPARLSGYNAVAGSRLGVFGKENTMLFLLPNYGASDIGSYSDGQYADWRMGVTPLRPEQDGNTVKWYKKNGDLVPEFTNEYKIYAERYEIGISRDIDRYEISETNSFYVPPFTVDYRIPFPEGTNTGACSYLKISVADARTLNLQQYTGAKLITDSNNIQSVFIARYGTFNSAAYYLLSQSSSSPFAYDPSGSELGYNPNLQPEDDPLDPLNIPTVGSGVKFVTDFLPVSFTIGPGETVTYYVAQVTSSLTSPPPASQTEPISVDIYYIPIELITFRKLASGSFDYNPFPLYFFIEMRDGVTINSPVIKEEGTVQNIYNPSFAISEDMTYTNQNISVGTIDNRSITTGGLDDVPANFTSPNRLSSALIDTQGTSQLRPFEIIDRMYVGNQTKQIDLRAVFDFQKETITPDLLNTTAYFFIATSKENDTTDVSTTLNYLEQQ